jgi:hypothetical protein
MHNQHCTKTVNVCCSHVMHCSRATYLRVICSKCYARSPICTVPSVAAIPPPPTPSHFPHSPTHTRLIHPPFPALSCLHRPSEVLPPVQVGTPPFDFPFKLAGFTDVDPSDFVYAKTPGKGRRAVLLAAGHTETATSINMSPWFAYSTLRVSG